MECGGRIANSNAFYMTTFFRKMTFVLGVIDFLVRIPILIVFYFCKVPK